MSLRNADGNCSKLVAQLDFFQTFVCEESQRFTVDPSDLLEERRNPSASVQTLNRDM